MNEERIGWDQYFMEIAEVVARRSEDINHKVGCVAVRADNTIASTGYNGAPPGIKVDWENREEKNKRVIHAEQNSLKYCKPNEIQKLYVTLMPCGNCILAIAAYGIKTIIYKDEYHRDDSAVQLAKEFGIELIKYKNTIQEAEKVLLGHQECVNRFEQLKQAVKELKIGDRNYSSDRKLVKNLYSGEETNIPVNAQKPESVMTDERWEELMNNYNSEFTQEEIKQGWHFCHDFDGLLVGPGMGEVHFCRCRFLEE
jgi:dCMP deaminase